MSFQGVIENGVVVFSKPVPLANGTQVRVEPVSATDTGFWDCWSLTELARLQGVVQPISAEEMLDGWPSDELDDGFENVVKSWRERELEQILKLLRH